MLGENGIRGKRVVLSLEEMSKNRVYKNVVL